MKNTKRCPKCSSQNIVRVPDNQNRYANGKILQKTNFNCIYSMKKIEKYVLLDCDLDIALIMPTFGFEFGDKKFRCIDEKTSEMANEYMALFLGYDSFDLV